MVLREVSTDTVIRIAEEHGSWNKGERHWEQVCPNHDATKWKLVPSPFPRYLYRGQTARYRPCTPSIMRKLPRFDSVRALTVSDQTLLLRRLVNAEWFHREVKQLPVFKWAEQQRMHLDTTMLAQHYGLQTGYLDVTNSFEVAMFFATCKPAELTINPVSGKVEVPPVEAHRSFDGSPATGIIYRIDLQALQDFPLGHINAAGRIMFPRPHEQWAHTLELRSNEDFENVPGLEAIEFMHDRRLGEWVLSQSDRGNRLYPSDFLEVLANRILVSESVPEAVLHHVIDDLRSDSQGLGTTDEEIFRTFRAGNGIRIDEVSLVSSTELVDEERDWQARQSFVESELVRNRLNHFRLMRVPKNAD